MPIFFFFNDTATTEIYTLSLHDALPILLDWTGLARAVRSKLLALREEDYVLAAQLLGAKSRRIIARHLVPEIGKSTRLNSSHANISYAVFCLKKKTTCEQRDYQYNDSRG